MKSVLQNSPETESPSLQSKGGTARAQKLPKTRLKEIAVSAADAKHGIEKSMFLGTLKIGEDMSFPCSVLSDGTRILTQSDFMEGMGMYYSGWVAQNSRDTSSADLPHFMQFEAIKPFIPKHLSDMRSVVVKYRTESGKLANGIKAEIIPKICEIWMDADEHVNLGKRQKQIAEKAKMMIRALAHVGIVALVDEATGYQEVRSRQALQSLLDAFLKQEFAAWAKRFPDEFYKELFRLRGWEWNRLSVRRPIIVGKLTNNVVYERLAPGVLAELESRNPKDEQGRRASRHHQWLSDAVGHPALAQHLHAVIGLMRASSTWNQFLELIDRAFPRRGNVLQLELFED